MTGAAINSILLADSNVTDIVGTKIFPNRAAQRVSDPFIIYSLLFSNADDDKDGPSDLDIERWQISSFSRSYSQVVDLSEVIQTAMERYSGTIASVAIQSIRFIDTIDIFEGGAQDEGIYHKASDYSIRIKL